MCKELSDLLDIALENKQYQIAYKTLQDTKGTYSRHDEYMEKLAGELITYYLENELLKSHQPKEQYHSKPLGFGQV